MKITKITSIGVTGEQHAMMKRHPEINWSAVCRAAIEAKLSSLDRDWLVVTNVKKKHGNRMEKRP